MTSPVAASRSVRGQSGGALARSARAPSLPPARRRDRAAASRRRRRLADAAQDLRRRRGHHRQQQHRRDAHGFGRVEQHRVEPRRRCAGSLASVHGAVSAMNSLVASTMSKRRGRALVQREARPSPRGSARAPRSATCGQPAAVAGRREPRRRGTSRAIAASAAHQVAEVVGQVDVVALLVALPREVAVAAVGDLLRQVQPQRVGAEPSRRRRPDRRSCRATCSCAGRRS